MNLFQIALNNLRRRKRKALLVLFGLTLGATAVVAVYSLVQGMDHEIKRQLAETGSNVVITADTGTLTFSYGGITVPELNFGVVELSEFDLVVIDTLPDRQAILVVSPKIVGLVPFGDTNLVIAGSDLQTEYAIKPWLRLYDETVPEAAYYEPTTPEMQPSQNIPVPELSENDLVFGAAVAEALGIEGLYRRAD